MGRISTSLSGIERTLLNRLAESNAAIVASTLRSATGQTIRNPRDNPAGYVRVHGLEVQLGNVNAALVNVSAASQRVSAAQLAIDQIATQLQSIRDLAEEDADQSLSSDERVANQEAIDEALDAIETLVATRSGTRRLLDGSADYREAGRDPNQIRVLEVLGRSSAASNTISGDVSVAATQATLSHTEGTGLITHDATLTITGARGSAQVDVVTGESLETVAQRIYSASWQTGVSAAVVGGTRLDLTSIDYGGGAAVQVEVDSGTFSVTGGDGAGTATGIDAEATINGIDIGGDGNRFYLSSGGLSFYLEVAPGFSGTFDSIEVSGEGLSFALSPETATKSRLAIPGLQTQVLGGISGRLSDLRSGGNYAGLGGYTAMALRIVDEAQGMLTRIQGRVDGFADSAIEASSTLLDAWSTDLSDALETENGVDDTEESARIALYQSLAENSIASLAILREQRSGLVDLVRQIAGLG